MNKWTSALLGAAMGVTASAIFLYLFAPARGTALDGKYQSRLDWALAEGRKAGYEREQELRLELEQAQQSPSAAQPTPAIGNNGAAEADELLPKPAEE